MAREAGRSGERLRARYRVYANELTVRTSHLDATHAFVSPASVFMYVRGREAEPVTVGVDAPAGWRVADFRGRPFSFAAGRGGLEEWR